MLCPKCNREYLLSTAISRMDGSNICLSCGNLEAIEAALDYGIMTEEEVKEIVKQLKEGCS